MSSPRRTDHDVSRLPPRKRLVRVALGLAFSGLAASLLSQESSRHGGVSVIWLSNGLLIGVLLCTPLRQWLSFFVLGYVIDLAINLGQGTSPGFSAFLSFCNMTEVWLGAVLMYRAIAPSPDLTETRQFRSLLLGILVGPAVASLLASLYMRMVYGRSFAATGQFWFAADVLGIATVTPLYLSYHYRRRFSASSGLEIFALITALFVASVVVFGLVKLPMLWMVMLFLILLGMRLGFTGSALGLLMVSMVGGVFTVNGQGPLADTGGVSMPGKILIFQLFIATTMLALYITEVARARGRRMRQRLEASETRFRLLAEASRDVIVLADLEGRREYVSPAMTELLGWSREELTNQHYSEIIHPDDVESVTSLLADCRGGEEIASSISYRGRKKDGDYLWLEANVRLLRDDETREPTGFVYVLRDISQRKAAEEELYEAFLVAQKLAMVDGLTGVANRRLLDETLKQEWVRAVRERTPLSVLLIDVDHFKKFNDVYGHLAGDACLQKIARTIQQVLKRPQDLLARYGGEEFVVVLPNTPRRGAELISERVREVVERCAIPHEASEYQVATVSVGCATTIPTLHSTVEALLKTADAALYGAKSGGRNRLQVAEEMMEIR
jgi:diguanylate cyclase (GGDEF)-like protein/PAS domain S-box-containing protein